MYEDLVKSLKICGTPALINEKCIAFHDGCCEAEPVCMYELMRQAADAIKVGDIVKNKKSPDAKMIVTSVISERKVVYINGIECGTNACGDYGGAAYSYCIADDWEKTGDSVPEIISLIKTVGDV